MRKGHSLVVAGLEAGGTGQRLEAKKGKKTDFSLEPLGKNTDLPPLEKVRGKVSLGPPGNTDLLSALLFAQWTHLGLLTFRTVRY